MNLSEKNLASPPPRLFTRNIIVVECLTSNQWVGGSSPSGCAAKSILWLKIPLVIWVFFYLTLEYGGHLLFHLGKSHRCCQSVANSLDIIDLVHCMDKHATLS